MKKQQIKQIIREEVRKVLTEGLKFGNVGKGEEYLAVDNFDVFKAGNLIYVDSIKVEGQEVTLELSSDTGERGSIKGDLNDEIEVFY
jgi:hypothetical protein